MKMKVRVKKHSLKLISVFLSIFLWVYVLNSEKVKFEKTVVLDYIVPEDMVFVEKPIQEVVFLIEGPRAFVRSVLEREDKLIIDLNRTNGQRQTSFTVDIIPTQLSLPFGMVVERVLPRKIPIKLEKKASKIVPVKPRFIGSLPKGISLAKEGVYPSEVEVYGPRSVILKLKSLQTAPIELEGLLGLRDVPVKIQFKDDRLSHESSKDFKLTYQLNVAAANMVLQDIPIRFLNHNNNAKSVSKTVTLKLFVPDKLKDRSKISSTVQVWADISPGPNGKVQAALKSLIPPGIELVEISPKTIIVNVE
jgi:YbbR domain-containing protein